MDSPGVVRELALGEPLAPGLDRFVDPLGCLRRAARTSIAAGSPGDRAEAALALLEVDLAVRPALAQLQVRGPCSGRSSCPPASASASPKPPAYQTAASDAVVEARLAAHLDHRLAVDAGGDPDQRASRFRTSVFELRLAVRVVPLRRWSAHRGPRPSRYRSTRSSRSPGSRVRNGGSAGRRRRAVRTGSCPAVRSSSAPKVLGESNRGRQSHSTDPSGRDQGGGVAVRQEAVAADRRKSGGRQADLPLRTRAESLRRDGGVPARPRGSRSPCPGLPDRRRRSP